MNLLSSLTSNTSIIDQEMATVNVVWKVVDDICSDEHYEKEVVKSEQEFTKYFKMVNID